MDYDQLRNKLAVLTSGQTIELKTPDLHITVTFNSDSGFHVRMQTRSGSSSISTDKLMSDTIKRILPYFIPKPGEVYQHINSNIYTVIAIANEHSKRPEYPPSVVYQGENGLVWVKPLTNFMRKMTRIK